MSMNKPAVPAAALLFLALGAMAPAIAVEATDPTAPREAETPVSTTRATDTPLPSGAPPASVVPGETDLEPSPQTAAVTVNREILLELGKRTISLVEDGQVKGSWPVAIGDPSTPTPLGTYKVENKVTNPQYQSTKSGKVNPTRGPQGPLGDRWMGFLRRGPDQFGIHGTPTAWSWTVTGRTAVTNGCVRMLTPHVRALFDQVEIGTPVVVKR